MISYDSKFHTWFLMLSKIYNFSNFYFPKNCKIWIKGQSEHSRFCPDIRTALFRLRNLSKWKWGMLFGLFKTVLYEKYIILYLTQRMRQWGGGSNYFCPFGKLGSRNNQGFVFKWSVLLQFGLLLLIILPPTLVMRTQQIQINQIHNLQNPLVFYLRWFFL